MSGPISVVIAEDNLLVRDSVQRVLSTDKDVTVVGVAEDYDSAVELIDRHRPTLLFTDVRMPPTSTDEGIRLARWLRTAHPDTGVIVLSQYAEPHYAKGLLDGGTTARGYLLKERISHFDQLNDAVHEVADGGTVLDPLVVEALLAQPNSAATLSRLTVSIFAADEPARSAEVNRVVELHGGPILYGQSAGGYENGLLILEAARCYRLGADLACILCSHACCERELAGILRWQQPATPNAERWGLGRLIRIGRERHWFNDELASRLEQVNENRRTLYHLQDFEAPTGLWRRAMERAENPVTKDDVADAIPGTLRQDALDALDCSFAVRTIEVERAWS